MESALKTGTLQLSGGCTMSKPRPGKLREWIADAIGAAILIFALPYTLSILAYGLSN